MNEEAIALDKRLKNILLRMQQQDLDALNELIDLMTDRLIDEAEDFLKDRHIAEGEVNTVMCKLYQKAYYYDKSRPALPYIISVLRNHCRDILRLKANKLNAVSIEELGEISISGAPYSEDLILDSCLDMSEKEDVLNSVGQTYLSDSQFEAREKLFSYLSEEPIEEHVTPTNLPGSFP